MNRTQISSDDQLTELRAARDAARRAAVDLAGNVGARIIKRPVYPGAQSTFADVESLAGMRAARQIQLGGRHAARDYIRQAREAGHSWHQIGRALDLAPGAAPDQEGTTLGEAAYTYAAGNASAETSLRCGRSFGWICRSCQHMITDRGLVNGPADDEHGHAKECGRLAATISARDTEWEAGQ